MTEMQVLECQESSENINADSEVMEAAGESSDDTDDTNSILKSISELDGRIDQMNQLFIQKIQHTAYEEKIVDQMHAELQKYKEDMYAQLVRPILLDIIEIRDSIRRISANYEVKPETDQCIPLKTFRDYTFDLQDVLEKNNITIYDSKEGDEFNSLKQRALKKVMTSAEELHGKIAESMSSGYDYMGKTISPEKVAVYIYRKPEITEGENING
ncbi:MAG: nucleotide exchange factor GrpE [Lachnospiraceae bacterium]|nr:nucleotide exchange factor GrpE [Lachnospiraceae bacterium]